MKHIQLFQCENETQTLPTEGWIPPFGLAYIATYAKQKGHDVEIYSPLNGITTREMLESAGKCDIVGLTTTISTYHTALKIARAAKSNNPRTMVVLGGPQASVLYKEILHNRGSKSEDYCVDVICYGDGVSSFVDGILEDRPMGQVPNFVFFDENGEIIRTQEVREDISRWPCIDYSLFNMDRVTATYGEKFEGVTPFKRGLGIISGFGCAAKHQCGFCARKERKLRLRPVEQFWHEVLFAIEHYGVNYFFDLADSILDSFENFKQLIQTRPQGISPRFRVFARADQLTIPENLDLLQKFGVYEVFIGFESGSRAMLKAMHKDVTPEQNLVAARELGERGIYIAGCFVLGAPGETRETLEETVRHARDIQRVSNNHLLVCGASPANILPGSPWFARIRNEDGIRGVDDLDRNLLRQIWHSRCCSNITPEIVEEYAKKIREASGAKMQYEKGTDERV